MEMLSDPVFACTCPSPSVPQNRALKVPGERQPIGKPVLQLGKVFNIYRTIETIWRGLNRFPCDNPEPSFIIIPLVPIPALLVIQFSTCFAPAEYESLPASFQPRCRQIPSAITLWLTFNNGMQVISSRSGLPL